LRTVTTSCIYSVVIWAVTLQCQVCR